MTHFKKHWMTLLSDRLKSGKRVIVKTELFPTLLCHCIKNGLGDVNVKIINTHSSIIINR